MGLFNFSFKSKSEKPTAVVNRISENGMVFGSGMGTAPSLTNQSAMEVSAVLACVKSISEGVATTPLRIMQSTMHGDLKMNKVAENHAIHKLINKPNGFMTAVDFWSMAVANAVLGKGFLAIKTEFNGQLRELIPVPSGSWVMELLSDGSYQFRVTMANGSQVIYGQNAVFYFKGLSLDGYSSISAIEKARKIVGISTTLENAQLQSAGNGGRPSGILTFDSPLDADQAKALRESWSARFGPGGNGGVAILDRTARFDQMQMSSADAQFIENRKFQIYEIARVFGVNPAMIGEGEIKDNTLRHHITTCLKPWFIRIEQAVNVQLLNGQPGYFCDYDDLDLLRADHKNLSGFFKESLGAGGSQAWMSVNEVRHEIGLDPLPDAWARKPSQGGYELSASGKVAE